MNKILVIIIIIMCILPKLSYSQNDYSKILKFPYYEELGKTEFEVMNYIYNSSESYTPLQNGLVDKFTLSKNSDTNIYTYRLFRINNNTWLPNSMVWFGFDRNHKCIRVSLTVGDEKSIDFLNQFFEKVCTKTSESVYLSIDKVVIIKTISDNFVTFSGFIYKN